MNDLTKCMSHCHMVPHLHPADVPLLPAMNKPTVDCKIWSTGSQTQPVGHIWHVTVHQYKQCLCIAMQNKRWSQFHLLQHMTCKGHVVNNSFFTPFNCNPMSDLVFANVFSFSFDITWYNITHPIPRKYARTEFWQDMRKIMKSSTCKLDQICCPSFANFEFHLRIASSKKALKEAGSRHLLVIPYQALHQFDLDSFAFLVAIIFFGKCLFCDYPPDPMYNLVASPHLPPRVQCPLNYNEPFDALPCHHLILAGKNGAPDLAWVAWMKCSCWRIIRAEWNGKEILKFCLAILEVVGLDWFLFQGSVLQTVHWGVWERRANDTSLAPVLWPLQRVHLRVDKLLAHPMC